MINGSKVILREKRLADAHDDYSWQADPELARLDAAPVMTLTFSWYLETYADELRRSRPDKRRFAIDIPEGKHIGNCSYYGLNEAKGEAELGIMIGNRDYWDKSYGTDTVTTLLGYIFSQTDLKRIHLKTLESNLRAQKCFRKCGFTPYKHVNRGGYRFVLMEIYREQWEERQTGVEN